MDAAPRSGERKEGTGAVDMTRQKGRSNTRGSRNHPRYGGGGGLEVVKEFRERKQWVWRINNASVMVPTVIETLTDRRGFAIEALLDCGAMGCYIDKGFAVTKNLPMEQLPRPIPVYNADGTHNEGGPISHTVTLRVQIKDHIEVFPFAVTNTGKTDLIIGFNWL